MRYYIIINGVNSLTIPGLAIRTLPPISKPAMRNLREEIDGRDGDITTELGYGAYDRILEIGLYGAYDIDRIISFFNTKGTIIFSDEPDKYYNFEIVDKIDYTKLVKFRTASINIHCQPFKYPTEEEPEVEEYEYVEETGEALTLNNTAEAILNKIELIGNTEQTQYTGYQLFDFSNVARTATKNGVTYTINDDGSITITGTPTTYTSFYFRGISLPAGTYYANQIITRNANVFMQAIGDYSVIGTGRSFTIDEQKSASWYLVINNAETGVAQNETLYPMLKKDSNPTTYEPYVGGIPSPNPNYPEPIHVVTGDNTIEITGRNILDDSILELFNANKYIKTPDYNIKGTIKVQPNTTYTFSTQNITFTDINVYEFDENNNRTTLVKHTITQQHAFWFTTSATAKTISFYSNNNGLEMPSDLDIQIEHGNQVHEYEEYQSQSLPIYLGVENFFDVNYIQERTVQGITMTIEGQTVHLEGTPTGTANFYMKSGESFILEAGEYYISRSSMIGAATLKLVSGSTTIVATGNNDITFTLAQDTTIDGLTLQVPSSAGTIDKDITISIIKGNKFQHVSENPIEMAAIPGTDYKDVFIKDGETWYKREAVGKKVLVGTENWTKRTDITAINTFIMGSSYQPGEVITNSKGFCNYFRIITSSSNTEAVRFIDTNGYGVQVQVGNEIATTSAAFKTWVTSHNLIVYFPRQSITDIEVNETLAGQLEAIKNAISYNGQTNVSQTNNDEPFILDISALKEGSDHLVINNAGNIYAKPTIDIEGTGVVDIYLNDVQILEADLSETNNIVIDTESMEAYNPDTNALANRQVTGDYSKIKLEPGENDLRFSGDLSKATVTKYKRWL